MQALNLDDVRCYVKDHIGDFHTQRIECLKRLQLKNVLRRKNPYLFRAKDLLTSQEIVRSLVDAHLSSNEETLFGDWLEGLAIYVSKKTCGGYKSGIPGIDLEFDRGGNRYIVNIKSSPNWGNSSQIKKMVADFRAAKKTLRTSNSQLQIVAVNGCCYGREVSPDKGEYFKYCGQEFWEFISGNENLYCEIISPLGHMAKQKNEEFRIEYSKILNRFTIEFSKEFCLQSGEINWEEFVRYNSGKSSVN